MRLRWLMQVGLRVDDTVDEWLSNRRRRLVDHAVLRGAVRCADGSIDLHAFFCKRDNESA